MAGPTGLRRASAALRRHSGSSGGTTSDSGCISAIALAIPPADSGGNLIRPRGVPAVPQIFPAVPYWAPAGIFGKLKTKESFQYFSDG